MVEYDRKWFVVFMNDASRHAVVIDGVKAKTTVILPMSFTKDLRGMAKLSVSLWRLLGFAPKHKFDLDSYGGGLTEIGFEGFELIPLDGKILITVAICRKNEK